MKVVCGFDIATIVVLLLLNLQVMMDVCGFDITCCPYLGILVNIEGLIIVQ